MGKRIPILVVILSVIYYLGSKDSPDPESIKGKRVLITGASSGIGEHLAYQYSRLGAKVFITARRAKLLESVAQKCKELGASQVEFMTSDLGDQKHRDKVITEVKKRFSGLDHLILNHAILTPRLWSGSKEHMASFRNEMDVNFFSFVDLASQSLPMLTESKGNIGIVSAGAGKMALGGMSTYSTSKFALNGFFSALRQELRYNNTDVSVTTCIIGPVNTNIVKITEEKEREMLGRMPFGYDLRATPEDTAMAIMTAVANRKYEICYAKSICLMLGLHKIFPGFTEDVLGRDIMELALRLGM